MPRPAGVIIPGAAHHVTQRGNDRQKVFYRDEDRSFYVELLTEYSRHYGVSVLAWCLMPNHVHLVTVPHDERALSRMLQRIHSDYARALHLRLRRVGHLWQARFHSVAMDEEHFWLGMVYVEQNPVRAGLVEAAWDWKWSSARGHVEGHDEGLLDFVEWPSRHTPASWKRCLQYGIAEAVMLERIREATLKGLPLGSPEFLERVESEYGVRVRPSKPGPKPAMRKGCCIRDLRGSVGHPVRELGSLTPNPISPNPI